jgi:bifunctional non-homologous end joining protein LigD
VRAATEGEEHELQLLRYRRHDDRAFLYAFDLIERDGDDLRRESIEKRKTNLARLLARAADGVRLNEHMEGEDTEVVFHHACQLGCEGIVSKRKGSGYRSGRSWDWIKMKDPASEAVGRERRRIGK